MEIELGAAIRTTGHQKATVPHQPDLAKKYKLTVMAGLGVFSLIVVVIVWFEFQARRISSLEEVVEGLSMRIIGSLPIVPNWMSNGKHTGKKSRHSIVRSIWTESIDAARTVLLRDTALESRKVVMVCSAVGGEGKTTLACHLATSLARSGRKTLLVDADMRRSSLHKVFDVEDVPGFCELLRGDVELEDALRPVSPEGLQLLTAGKINQLALRALSSDAPVELFKRFKEEFDFIIVDSAPLLPVTDSLLVGQHVDAALFAIRRDVSRYGKVATACERLAMLGIPLMGAVVIGLDETSYGYRYPYRYYSYGGYGYNVHSEAHS
ncbi:MAG: CpsD/CapB family tyrosine-protein kinase [Planctomycetes bacterium]|nr:CpsD/CapB family tyrosine-protein kinase [Planctomycetota bacterium]